MDSRTINMCEGPLFKKVILYTLPIIFTGILQLLFNAADLVVVGRFCGSVSVAAVGATSAITNLIVSLFIGLSTGTGVAVAHAIGSRNDAEVSRVVHTAIPTAVISAAIVSVIGIGFSETFLSLMGTPEKVLPLSTLYMRIYFSGMIFNLVYNFGASILRAAGDTKSPLIFLLISGVLNVVLNVIFVTVFHLDVAGVSIATVASQALSAVLVVIALMRRNDACRLCFSKLRIHKDALFKIMRIGVPSGIQSSTFGISNTIIQSSVNSFGDFAVSGNAAAASIEGFVYIIMNAFSHAAINFVGQNYGAGNYSRIKRVLTICLFSVGTIGLVLGVAVYSFGRPLLGIYITDSEEAISVGLTKLLFVCAPYFVCGLLEVASGTLRGIGRSLTAMLISILVVCGFRIVWIYTVFQLPECHTLGWLFVCYPLSQAICFVLQLLTFFKIYKKFKTEKH